MTCIGGRTSTIQLATLPALSEFGYGCLKQLGHRPTQVAPLVVL